MMDTTDLKGAQPAPTSVQVSEPVTIEDPNLGRGSTIATPVSNIPKKHITDMSTVADIDPESLGIKETAAIDPRLVQDPKQELYDKLGSFVERKNEEMQRFAEAVEESRQIGEPLTEAQWRAMEGSKLGDIGLKESTGTVITENGIVSGEEATSAEQKLQSPESKKITSETDFDALLAELEADENYSYDPSELEVVVKKSPTPAPVENTKIANFVPKTEEGADADNSVATAAAIKNLGENGKLELSREDKALAALDETGDTINEEDSMEEKIKQALREKIRPRAKALNIDSFRIITDHPITADNVIVNSNLNAISTFDWALPNSHRPISLTRFSATDLNNLEEAASDSSPIQLLKTFQYIWDHIVGPKGKNVLEFLKCTSYYDLRHIWAAVYGACFDKSNYIPYTCVKCDQVTIVDDVPILEMTKFKNDKVKEAFLQLRDTAAPSDMKMITAGAIVPITDTLAIQYREPTIYSQLIEISRLDAKFREEFAEIIGAGIYIEDMYFIDWKNEGLRPVIYKKYKDNEGKTYKSKILTWSKIISTYNSDDYSAIYGMVYKFDERADDIRYMMPEKTCDHCTATMKEAIVPPENMVFTRHRLARVLQQLDS